MTLKLPRALVIEGLALAGLSTFAAAQTISPQLVGNDLWLTSRDNAAGTPTNTVQPSLSSSAPPPSPPAPFPEFP